MLDTDKIVAAILTVGYAGQNGGGVKTRNYVELYEEFLSELTRPKPKPEVKVAKTEDAASVRSEAYPDRPTGAGNSSV